MMRLSTAIIGVTLLAGPCLTASGAEKVKDAPDGADRRKQRRRQFERFDRDKDGIVTIDDLPERARSIFGRLDKDGDGRLTSAEFTAARPNPASKAGKPGKRPKSARKKAKRKKAKNRQPNPGRFLQRFDKNGDGAIDREEAPGRLKQSFKRADRDGDGKITRGELAAVFKRMQQFRGRGAGNSPRGLFNVQDKNADGRVTKQEATGALATRFAEFDSNGDDKLDVYEVEIGMKPPARSK